MSTHSYDISLYRYTLPDELIAQEAIHPHHDARLMVIDRASWSIANESTFWNLGDFLESDRVLFFNNSRVLPARIRLSHVYFEDVNGKRGTIEDGEILFLAKKWDNRFEALIRPGKKFRNGTKIFLREDISLEVIDKTEGGRILEAHGAPIEEVMRKYGELPLPPYIEYKKEKEVDYQTSFAEKDGSVAAPTASLHFTSALLERLPNRRFYTTLHVGLGTFQGITTEDVRDYAIHRELAEVTLSTFEIIRETKSSWEKIVAVGTTVCRTLESLPYLWLTLSEDDKSLLEKKTRDYWDTLTKEMEPMNYTSEAQIDKEKSVITFFTEIYLYPGRSLSIVDELITNFHLSESSLIVLVSTLLGRENTLDIYSEAIEKKYRFFSFGDGMYIKNFDK